MGYGEQTYIRPRDGIEVYGANGYGFYTYADDAAKLAGEMKFVSRASKNPLFVYLDGVTSKTLTRHGFMK